MCMMMVAQPKHVALLSKIEYLSPWKKPLVRHKIQASVTQTLSPLTSANLTQFIITLRSSQKSQSHIQFRSQAISTLKSKYSGPTVTWRSALTAAFSHVWALVWRWPNIMKVPRKWHRAQKQGRDTYVRCIVTTGIEDAHVRLMQQLGTNEDTSDNSCPKWSRQG
jgi:hypothetical protein